MTEVKMTFDAAAYSVSLNEAVVAWRTGDKRADKVARNALAALMLGDLSPLAVAINFYDAVEPTNAKGDKTEPKEKDDGTIQCRNLEQPHIAGSGGARKCLETVLFVHANKGVSDEASKAVEAFIIGGRSAMKLNPLRRFIEQEKARVAREAAKAAGVTVSAPANDEGDEPETVGNQLADILETLRGIASLSDSTDAIALAAIATEIDRLNATLQAEGDEPATGTEG